MNPAQPGLLARLLGWRSDSTSHLEKAISALGGFCGIALIYACTHWLLPLESALWVIASMGASAVLLFAVPHGVLSQPWSVLGGHGLSALVGVTCQMLWPGEHYTPALAVGLAILVMHYTRCIHPPGGATALCAVIGDPAIEALGYSFMLAPVLLNVGLILLVAVVFNGLFPWRRYPAGLARPAQPAPQRDGELAPEDFYHALRQMDSFRDLSFEDLLEIQRRAQAHARNQRPTTGELLPGACYSNAQTGQYWAVRQLLSVPQGRRRSRRMLKYRQVAGERSGEVGHCTPAEFAAWAAYAVAPEDSGWLRVSPAESVQRCAERLPPVDPQ